jgi:hypothetical protein
MGYFGEDFAKQFFGPGQGLKDYSHASLTFRSNGYELTPRYKFLFHVYFTINTGQIPKLQNALGGSNPVSTIGLAVKSVELPSYTVKVDTLNQYNRKRLVQSKIDYNPISIVFHDDQSDLIRNMWYNYYSYYYKDPSQSYDNVAAQSGTLGASQTKPGFGYNARDIYAPNRSTNDWGYIGESYSDGNQQNYNQAQYTGKPPFFRDIKIYAINQKKFASYVLINPMITDWKHDTFDYSQGNGTMTHTMSLRYETVKYYTGAIGGTTPSGSVFGFADPAHYDTTKSSLARPGATATVFGQGGLVDAGAGVVRGFTSPGVWRRWPTKHHWCGTKRRHGLPNIQEQRFEEYSQSRGPANWQSSASNQPTRCSAPGHEHSQWSTVSVQYRWINCSVGGHRNSTSNHSKNFTAVA